VEVLHLQALRKSKHMVSKCILMESEYFPCIAWFADYLQSEPVIIDDQEAFVRSSYRNRCEVAGAQGKLILSVPLEGGRNARRLIADVKICYRERWQQVHWRSIEACYRRTPYFEFYESRLCGIFEHRFEYLVELNTYVLGVLLDCLKLKPHHQSVKESHPETIFEDQRQKFSPSLQDHLSYRSYLQPFQERNGFIPHLSVLDMLCCIGPDTITFLGQKNA
jgi:hypothetical protein